MHCSLHVGVVARLALSAGSAAARVMPRTPTRMVESCILIVGEVLDLRVFTVELDAGC